GVVGAPVFTAIALAFSFAGGYIAAIGTHAVHDPRLRATVQTLERREHVSGTPVRVQKVSNFTKEINAFSTGLGSSSRVVVWDTLLDGRFTHREVPFVLAHGPGHRGHPPIP